MKQIVFIEFESNNVPGRIPITDNIIPRENEYVQLNDEMYRVISVIYKYDKQSIIIYIKKISISLN